MKRLLLLLLLLPTLLNGQTTGRAYWPVSWDKGTQIVYGRVLRDYAVYPVTTGGDAAFFAAIGAGTLPVLDRVGPAWASARVTYLLSKRLLEVEAASSANIQVKFERADSTSVALSGGNPDGSVLSSGVFYDAGPTGLSDYQKHWVFGKTGAGFGTGIPPYPIKLTFKNTDNNQTFVQVFKPINRASRAQLFVASGSSPPPTAPVTLVGGFAEGTLSNLLALAPFVPTTNQYSSWPYGGMTAQYLDNGTIKAGFAKALGSTLSYLSESGSSSNLINNNSENATSTVEGQVVPDDGRQAGFAPYGTPFGYSSGPYSDPFTDSGQTDTGIGWNGVVGGSINQNHSPILFFERRTVAGYGEVLYFKTQPQQWEFNNVLAKCYIHSYYWLEGRALRYFYIYENFRDDSQMHFRGRTQELPFAYITAPHYRYFVYTGDSPGTSGSLTQINKSQPTEGGGSDNSNDTGEFISTEHWIGGVNTADQGVFIVTPYNSRFNGKQFQSWGGSSSSNASAYINATPHLNLDIPGQKMAFTGYFYVGGLSAFRSWYNASGIVRMPFSFNFAAGKTGAWWPENAPAKFNSDGRYEFSLGNGGASLYSPDGSWKASDIPTIYIKGRFTGVTTINLQWLKPGETPIYSAGNNNKQVTVIGDGVERTYTVTMSGTSNWSGTVSTMKVQNPYPVPGSTSSTASFIPTYIGSVNPD